MVIETGKLSVLNKICGGCKNYGGEETKVDLEYRESLQF